MLATKQQPAIPELDAVAVQFVLPADVLMVPVEQLAEPLRRQIPHAPGDLAVSRPGLRRPSQIIDTATAELLEEFRQPSRFAEAIARYCRRRGLEPGEVLDAAFDPLNGFVSGRVLVPADSDLTEITTASLIPGQDVAGYQIVRLVQALEDTELYQARTAGGRLVALKIARPGSPAAAMLAREAAILQHLTGRWAPAWDGDGVWVGRAFVASTWHDGIGLAAAARRLRAQPHGRHRLHALCADLVAAFAALHRQHVVHGDVHPGNVLAGEQVVLLDYGLSRWLGPQGMWAHAPRSGVAFYHEPELARAMVAGEALPEATFASDQYALAVLLYQLLTGEHPQRLPWSADLLPRAILSEPRLPFVRHGVAAWPEVEAVLQRAMDPDPQQRFDDLDSMLAAFRAAAPVPPPALALGPSPESTTVARMLAAVSWDSPWFEAGLPAGPKASLAFGAAGIAWFLWRAALRNDDARLLALADAWHLRIPFADAQAWTGDALTLSGVAPVSPFHGEAGPGLVGALLARARGDDRGIEQAIARLVACGQRRAAAMDLLLGQAGGVLAAVQLFALRGDPRLSALGASLLTSLSPGGLRGRGLAHGTPGVVYTALRAKAAWDTSWPAWLHDELELLCRAPSPETSSWCSGSAGLVPLWLAAHAHAGDAKFMALAEQAALRAWQGSGDAPDLCCGLAGRAFAVLGLYQYTGDRVWLERARRLTRRACQHTGAITRPWSLFKGTVGVALLAIELEAPELAQMPWSAG